MFDGDPEVWVQLGQGPSSIASILMFLKTFVHVYFPKPEHKAMFI